ncbi:PadR family transcriptional regulator [Actinopolymorpha pittospori]|uniref:DNA-binding PadR family transcriptional regulator n=1 Tax=Actinopolymorpha pittospori TaxID=648752 RepID=A0A927MSW7_9ACTN|nr:PadR family transcriptional regulator [Actinopolymorpha pittospori]MBE1606305.1 DNA-binding PadR family transcriptional regulator [Actinopolymorpha pittospori]
MVAVGQLTPLSLAVLELLHERPMHPYEMHQTMRVRHTDRVVNLKAGSLYHSVERLERLGLVEITETVRAGRRPERTVYAVTDAGREAFAAQVADRLGTPTKEFPGYPLALSLAHALDRRTALVELTRRQQELEHTVDFYRLATERLRDMGLEERFWLDVKYLLTMREAELAWTANLIAEIESGRLDWKPDKRSELSEVIGPFDTPTSGRRTAKPTATKPTAGNGDTSTNGTTNDRLAPDGGPGAGSSNGAGPDHHTKETSG